jgi:hypothetical protein
MNLETLTQQPYHKGKHDNIVKQVVNRLEETGLYDCIKHNVNYRLNNGVCGEADVLASSSDRFFAFEIKSSHRGSNKAEHQLKKDSVLLSRFNPDSVYLFHVFKDRVGEIVYRRIIK